MLRIDVVDSQRKETPDELLSFLFHPLNSGSTVQCAETSFTLVQVVHHPVPTPLVV